MDGGRVRPGGWRQGSPGEGCCADWAFFSRLIKVSAVPDGRRSRKARPISFMFMVDAWDSFGMDGARSAAGVQVGGLDQRVLLNQGQLR